MGQMGQLVYRVGFEHLLLFLDPKIEDRAEEISEADWLLSAQHDHAHFRWHLRQVSQRLLDQLLHVALDGFNFFFVYYFQFGKNLHPRALERFALHPFEDADSIRSLHDQVQRIFDTLHPLDHDQGADVVKVFRFGVAIRSLVGTHTDAGQQFLFGGEGGFDRRN